MATEERIKRLCRKPAQGSTGLPGPCAREEGHEGECSIYGEQVMYKPNDAQHIRRMTIREVVHTFAEIMFVNRLREEGEHTLQWDEHNKCVRIYVKPADEMIWKEVLHVGKK